MITEAIKMTHHFGPGGVPAGITVEYAPEITAWDWDLLLMPDSRVMQVDGNKITILALNGEFRYTIFKTDDEFRVSYAKRSDG